MSPPSIPPASSGAPSSPRPAVLTGGPYPVRAQIHMCPHRPVLRQLLPPPADPAGRPSAVSAGAGKRQAAGPARGDPTWPLGGGPAAAAEPRRAPAPSRAGAAAPPSQPLLQQTRARPWRRLCPGAAPAALPEWARPRQGPGAPLGSGPPCLTPFLTYNTLTVPLRSSALSTGVSSSVAHPMVPLVPASPLVPSFLALPPLMSLGGQEVA